MAEQDPTVLNQFMDDVSTRLGVGIIDIELDPKHLDLAFRRSIMRYRQKSDNSMEESFMFLDLQPEQSTYTLPSEVQEIHYIYRRTIGGSSGGAAIDPFSLAFTNNIYMIQNPGALGTTGSGFIATYDLAMGFQSVVGRMFGRELLFVWNASTKKLTIERHFTYTEQVLMHVYNAKPIEVLLKDPYAQLWLQDYTVAQSKLIMAEARGKYQQLAGPQGGITMNADKISTEAKDEIERLDKELENYNDQHAGAPFIIG